MNRLMYSFVPFRANWRSAPSALLLHFPFSTLFAFFCSSWHRDFPTSCPNPARGATLFRTFDPDFSVLTDLPRFAQICQIYRFLRKSPNFTKFTDFQDSGRIRDFCFFQFPRCTRVNLVKKLPDLGPWRNPGSGGPL